jgi:hypothetical protein
MLTSPFRDGVVPKPRMVSHTTHQERQHEMASFQAPRDARQHPSMPDLGNLQLSNPLRLKRLRGDLTDGPD